MMIREWISRDTFVHALGRIGVFIQRATGRGKAQYWETARERDASQVPDPPLVTMTIVYELQDISASIPIKGRHPDRRVAHAVSSVVKAKT